MQTFNEKVRKLIKYILLGFNLLVIVAMVIAYASGYISPEKNWIPSFFGLAYPVILLLNIGFVVFWLFTKPRYLFISLFVILAGWGYVSRFIQFKGRLLEKGDIRVLSYNVNHFKGVGELTSKQTADEIIRFLKSEKPDIVCLQEVRLRYNNIFNLSQTVEKLGFINHYQYARSSSTFGSVTLSRFPVLHMEEVRFDNSRNITICTDLLIGKDTVRIFNVHLHSFGIDPLDYAIVEQGIYTEEDLKGAREMGLKLRSGYRIRAGQVETVRKMIRESPYPVIVCGDLNETPVSYAYHQLQKGLRDAFVCSGKGIGRTFMNLLPVLRIDYILHSKVFKSYNFQTHDFLHSDHLPVSADLVIKRQSEGR